LRSGDAAAPGVGATDTSSSNYGATLEKERRLLLRRALENLRGAVFAGVSQGSLTAEQIREDHGPVNGIAKKIDEF
jgi:hypothetical protein